MRFLPIPTPGGNKCWPFPGTLARKNERMKCSWLWHSGGGLEQATLLRGPARQVRGKSPHWLDCHAVAFHQCQNQGQRPPGCWPRTETKTQTTKNLKSFQVSYHPTVEIYFGRSTIIGQFSRRKESPEPRSASPGSDVYLRSSYSSPGGLWRTPRT